MLLSKRRRVILNCCGKYPFSFLMQSQSIFQVRHFVVNFLATSFPTSGWLPWRSPGSCQHFLNHLSKHIIIMNYYPKSILINYLSPFCYFGDYNYTFLLAFFSIQTLPYSTYKCTLPHITYSVYIIFVCMFSGLKNFFK